MGRVAAHVKEPTEARSARFRNVAWAVLAYNVGVVLWGAFVRATGSGAGCGSHWPLCNGEVVPRAPKIETIIEFTHRVTSGVALAAVAALCLWSFRLFPRGHRVRRFAALSVVFLLAEALLGAGLVLFRFVARDASAGRAFYLSAHLVNTQVLLAMLALTAWFARPPEAWTEGRRPKTLLATLPVALAVSVTGAIAALGDTLYPASSLAAGIRQEFSSAAQLLLRLRLFHPAVAVVGGAYLFCAALRGARANLSRAASTAAWMSAALVLAQLAAGAVNVILLAPVWMQILHLLLADLLWIALVILAADAPRTPSAPTEGAGTPPDRVRTFP